VTYLQITPRSRSKIREYLEMERLVSSAAGHINGTHGDASWTPIRYINQSYGRNVLAGLYRSARVGLVTPLRDGMNLVAKEYVASQNATIRACSCCRGSPVRRANAKRPFSSTLRFRIDGDAIARALSMPLEERRERHNSIMRVLAENDIKFWGDKFITELELTYDEMTMFAAWPRRIARPRARGKKLLSVPIPKLVIPRGTFSYDLRVRGTRA